MEKPIVEQCREYYPMTFYPDSLSKMLSEVNEVREKSDPIFQLKPIPLIIKKIHYYNDISFKQFSCGYLTVFFLLLSVTNILLSNKLFASALLLLTAFAFVCYCSLQIYKNNLRKELVDIEQKLSSRQYIIKAKSSNSSKIKLSSLLLNSLAERENIYNFQIDDSANKGLSESYFLSYLQNWFDYPWECIPVM